MKFTIADAKVVELKVDGKSLGLFQIVSEWEGFKKLQLVNGSSCVILAPLEIKMAINSRGCSIPYSV